ncbi:MAG: right-handed parallel beta-helix repeat-containing protein [Planctomycetota bacterium]|jgi:hypothetical protein
MLRLALCLLASGGLALPAHSDLIVGPPASGADFTDLQAAIDAAASGETLFLLPGRYEPFTVFDKGLQIFGSSEAEVFIGLEIFSPFSNPATSIEFIQTDQAVVISGVTFRSEAGTAGTVVRSNNVFGKLVFHDVRFETIEPTGLLSGVVTIDDSNDVLFDHCRIEGYDPSNHPSPAQPRGGIGLEVAGFSNVVLNQCTVIGGSTGQSAFGEITAGAAVEALSFGPNVTIHGGEYRGGSATFQNVASASAVPAPAFEMGNQPANFSGPPGTLIRGGDGYLSGAGVNVPGAPAIEWQTSLLNLKVIAQGPEIVGGVGGDGVTAEPFLSIAGFGPTQLPEFFPGLSLPNSVGAPGSSVTVDVEGSPGGLHSAFLSTTTVTPFELPGFEGSAYLDPSDLLFIGLVSLGATGEGQFGIAVPGDPAFSGIIGWFQTVEFVTQPIPRISLPAGFRVE